MSVLSARNSYLRIRGSQEDNRVTFVELFFDLVFVFAVTQISHTLLAHLSVTTALEMLLILMAVWWVWIYTSWATNWVDPQRTPVRLMLYVLMLAGLVLSTSIPDAFGARGLYFAAAFAFMQVGRSLFMVWAFARHHPGNYRNFLRITSWLAAGAVFWVAGGLTDGEARVILWLIGLAIEYTGPVLGFWTPGLGCSATTDWDIDGSHMAERCGLFMIIALGESILLVGATFATLDWNLVTVAAFATLFVGCVAMWWIYFNAGAVKATDVISHTDDPGRIARLAYTYLHILIVAGLIIVAVAGEMVLAHPLGHASLAGMLVTLGGPALFLFGNICFKKAIYGRQPLSHLVGLVLLGGTVPLAHDLTPLALAATTMAVLVLVAVWETCSLRPRPQSPA